MAKKKYTTGEKIGALVLNILLIPGTGSLLLKTNNAIPILVLWALSIPLMFILIGFLTMPIAWIWGIIDVVKAINNE